MTAYARFLDHDDAHKEAKPYIWRGPAVPGLPASNAELKERALDLTDVRTLAEEAKPTLDTHGFTFIQHQSKTLSQIGKDEQHYGLHMAEMEEFVKSYLGVDTVIGYNAKTRSTRQDVSERQGPVSCEAHIDNNPDSIWPNMSKPLTEEERDQIRTGQVRIRSFNFWRPIVDHAEDYPLAVCDPNSIDFKTDIVMTDYCSQANIAEASFMIHKPQHKWYWLSNQTPDEVIVFTQYDSHPPRGVFRHDFNHVPHTAFRNAAARPGCPPRQSIETRFLVLSPAPYDPPARNASTAMPGPDPRQRPYLAHVQSEALGRVQEPPAPASKADRGIELAFKWDKPAAPATIAAK